MGINSLFDSSSKYLKKLFEKKKSSVSLHKSTNNINPQKHKIMRATTKHKLVHQHLINKGNITSLEAIELYSATRLSAIIFNLRAEGKKTGAFDIGTESIKFTDKFGNEGTYARYHYISDLSKFRTEEV